MEFITPQNVLTFSSTVLISFLFGFYVAVILKNRFLKKQTEKALDVNTWLLVTKKNGLFSHMSSNDLGNTPLVCNFLKESREAYHTKFMEEIN
jgi:hypothetical protein